MWPGPTSPSAQHPFGLFGDDGAGARHTAGSRLPCTRPAGPDPDAGGAERHAPVDADDVGPRLGHETEQLAGAYTEVDPRDAEVTEALEDLARGGHGEGRVVRRRRVHPAQLSKSWTADTPAATWARSEARARSARRSRISENRAGSSVHEGLGLGEGPRGAPFDEVAGKCERCTREPDQRALRTRRRRAARFRAPWARSASGSRALRRAQILGAYGTAAR